MKLEVMDQKAAQQKFRVALRGRSNQIKGIYEVLQLAERYSLRDNKQGGNLSLLSTLYLDVVEEESTNLVTTKAAGN